MYGVSARQYQGVLNSRTACHALCWTVTNSSQVHAPSSISVSLTFHKWRVSLRRHYLTNDIHHISAHLHIVNDIYCISTPPSHTKNFDHIYHPRQLAPTLFLSHPTAIIPPDIVCSQSQQKIIPVPIHNRFIRSHLPQFFFLSILELEIWISGIANTFHRH
jgi:hypothetical protein